MRFGGTDPLLVGLGDWAGTVSKATDVVAPTLHAAHIWMLFPDHIAISLVSQPVDLVFDDPVPVADTVTVAPL